MAAAGETEQGAESAPRKKKRQKKIMQRAEGAQPEATEAMGFNFLTDGFARSSVQSGVPMVGTPVFCFETVDWDKAAGQHPKRFSAK